MKYLRRLIWHFASRLFLFTFTLGLVVVAFYYAMNLSNIQLILKDGMAKRAEVVMTGEDISRLNNYFQSAFLERDAAMQAVNNGQSPYVDYIIKGIDHRMEMGYTWIWPWDTTCRLEITESIPHIDGRAKGTKAEALVAAGGAGALYPPKWRSGRYRVVLAKENGHWLIRSLTLIEYLDD